jgi:chlorophyll synthase
MTMATTARTAVRSTTPIGSAVALSRPSLATVAELFKPITWFPPMWAFGCGVVSSAMPLSGRWPMILLGVALAGPLVCATSQAVNDWFDRHVDAINEPQRPIPSGRMPGRWGLYLGIAWTLLSLLVAAVLGRFCLGAALLGLGLAWAYSAPPLRLKLNGWWGNAACGLSYEGLAWITGAAVMLGGALPDGRTLALALLYSAGAHGIMTLNDFKAIEGDRALGVRSLPVQLGPQRAAQVACAVMLLPQLVVVALLVRWGALWQPMVVAALIAVQSVLMVRFLAAPVRRATWYSALGINFYVVGMLVSAFAVRALAAT